MTHLPAPEDRSGGTGIGGVLRAARAQRGVSFSDLQARTKVSARHLAALEEERFGDLPPLPFARGFLRAVALELGLEPEPLVRRLEAAMAGRGATDGGLQRLDGAIMPAVPPSRVRRLAMTAITLVGLAALGVGIYLAEQFREFSQPAPAATPQPAASPTPPAATGAPAAITETPPGPPPAGAGVTLDLEATGRSWLRVVVDGEVVFQDFMIAGQVRRWQAREAIAIRVGNAGAVRLSVNGVPGGPLGRPGEVVDRTFHKDGLP